MQTPDTAKRLQSLLDRLIPPEAAAVANQITDQEESIDYPEEEQHLTKAVLKRRNEFIVGRRCARLALEQIGVSPCALPPDKDRTPRWPEGVQGSISHSIGLCCAVVVHSDAMACLGVDLEKATRIKSGVIERIVHPLEVDFVGADQARGCLIFSAKEAFFKAQFPTWGVWPDFGDLAFRVDTSTSQLRIIRIASHLPPDLQAAAEAMQFHYAFFDDYVLTLCYLDRGCYQKAVSHVMEL